MRVWAIALSVVILLTALTPVTCLAKVDRQPGGIPAFLIGCCWGIREGSMWNEGADLHWREWCRLIPIVNLVIGIWDGVECMNGMTSHQWAEANGANWY
jgi:hypothetical protein